MEERFMNRIIHAIFRLTVVAVIVALFGSCRKSDIPTYDMSDAAVHFASKSSQFSLRGIETETAELKVSLEVLGPIADYDRPVAFNIISEGDDAAVEGVDFTVLSANVAAGAMNGSIVLEVKKLDASTSRKSVTLQIVPNDYFRVGFSSYSKTVVMWSDEYVRPTAPVWKCWHTYFSHYYSRALHELYVETFGEDVELYVNSTQYVNEETEYIYKIATWWFTASRTLYEKVQQHDRDNPESPLMHSDDCMYYSSYTTADGDGEKPERIPTILETLEVL